MGAAQQEHWGSWWLTDLDSTEKSSACCLYFCHNMLKLRQHYELSWPEFSDVFLAEKVSRRNMTKTHAGTHLSPHCGRAWEEKGDFTHQHNQLLSPRLHGLSCQTKYPDLPTFSGGNVLNFQKTVLWRAETGQKADTVSVRKTVVMVVASVWGHCVRVWYMSLWLRNDLCIHHNSSYLLSKTYRLYCLHFCLESTPIEGISVFREVNRLQKSAVCWFSSW